MPGLVPYLVPLEQLRAFAGSKDPNACMKIETLFKRELADEPGTDGALRRICMGEPATGNGTPYVWALEILCAHFGQKLPNASVAHADDEWLMRVVDPVFDAWRIGDFVKVKRLVYGAWPIKIPHAELPRGGAIEAPDLSRALEVMRKGALPKFDREIISVIGDMRGWLEACVARNAALVAFYYSDTAERTGVRGVFAGVEECSPRSGDANDESRAWTCRAQAAQRPSTA